LSEASAAIIGSDQAHTKEDTMASDNSFDVVSKVEIQEVKNAIDQASKEVHARFDLKDSKSKIELEGTDTIQLASQDD
jgi:uncharacterized protein YajQ (UPF0234 family)